MRLSLLSVFVLLTMLAIALAFVGSTTRQYAAQDQAARYVLEISPATAIEKRPAESIIARLFCSADVSYEVTEISCPHDSPDLHIPLKSMFALRLIHKDVTATDKEFMACAALPLLKEISMQSSSITDSAVQAAPLPKGIVEVDLSCSQLGDRGLEVLCRNSSIEHLRIGATGVTDVGAIHISQLQKLKSLDLTNTDVSGVTVQSIATIRTLEYLSLRGTRVNDADMSLLVDLPRLKTLDVTNTNITSLGRDRLQKSNSIQVLATDHDEDVAP